MTKKDNRKELLFNLLSQKITNFQLQTNDDDFFEQCEELRDLISEWSDNE